MKPSSLDGGRYTVLEKVGEGATKEVFLARDETLERDVAVCMFKRHVAEGYIERVRREARVLAGLSHPNIVEVYDFREEPDHCYMVTEQVAGGNLKSRFAPHHQEGLELDEALQVGAEVADALGYAHSQGVFHRDVKPSNILLTPEGTAKLGDFGMAKPLGDETLTDTGLIVGTVPYMSPEQAKGLSPDRPSDMYSFGVTLYEMVTGRRPFQGEDVSVLVHILESIPPPPTRFLPKCPPPLETLILELLEKEPGARPEAPSVAQELRSIRAELSGEPLQFPSAGSDRRTTDEEPEGEPGSTASDSDEPAIGRLSEVSIRKALLSDALQHPATIVPAFFAALSLVAWLLFPEFDTAPVVALAVSGAIGAVSFAWLYFFRYNREYIRRLDELTKDLERWRKAAEERELKPESTEGRPWGQPLKKPAGAPVLLG